MGWKVFSQENFGWGHRELRIGYSRFDGTRAVVLPFQFKTYGPNEFVLEKTIEAGTEYDATEFLQACVDHAAEIGIFPSKVAAPTREIDALKYHLEDMRKLVFR